MQCFQVVYYISHASLVPFLGFKHLVCGKTSLCVKLLVWKYMSTVRSFAWKSSHFHVKRFAQALVLKRSKRQLRSENKVYMHVHVPGGPLDQRLFRFSTKRVEVFLLPPGWDANPSQGYPQHLICQYLFTIEWILRHCESKVIFPARA